MYHFSKVESIGEITKYHFFKVPLVQSNTFSKSTVLTDYQVTLIESSTFLKSTELAGSQSNTFTKYHFFKVGSIGGITK